ncbi:MAG: class I SAM-dependent methyltransferase, partial [Nocardioides sp.]
MTLTDPDSRPGAGGLLGTWPGLDDVPTGPRACIASIITQRIFAMATRRLGVRVMRPGDQDPPTTENSRRPGAPTTPVITLHRPEAFFARVGTGGLIGFGEAYMVGDWDSPDLDRLLTVLARDLTTLVPAWMQKLRKTYVARHPRWHRNSTDNTRNNIAHHYDLSNDLFGAFLDETLSYSSALFGTGVSRLNETALTADPAGRPGRDELAAAQAAKIDRLLDITRVGIGTTVLEIGT